MFVPPAASVAGCEARFGGPQRFKRGLTRCTDLTLDDLARWLNPIIAGWMHYYGRYYRSAMAPLLQRVNAYLRRWAGKKYRRLRALKQFKRWWNGLLTRAPDLFAQWRWVRAF